MKISKFALGSNSLTWRGRFCGFINNKKNSNEKSLDFTARTSNVIKGYYFKQFTNLNNVVLGNTQIDLTRMKNLSEIRDSFVLAHLTKCQRDIEICNDYLINNFEKLKFSFFIELIWFTIITGLDPNHKIHEILFKQIQKNFNKDFGLKHSIFYKLII